MASYTVTGHFLGPAPPGISQALINEMLKYGVGTTINWPSSGQEDTAAKAHGALK